MGLNPGYLLKSFLLYKVRQSGPKVTLNFDVQYLHTSKVKAALGPNYATFYERIGFKSGLISEGICSLVSYSKICAKSLF